MAENTKRSIWSIHGLLGMLIAVLLLLGVLIFLQLGVVSAYDYAATAPYDEAPIRNINNVKMIAPMEEQKAFTFQEVKSEKQ